MPQVKVFEDRHAAVQFVADRVAGLLGETKQRESLYSFVAIS